MNIKTSELEGAALDYAVAAAIEIYVFTDAGGVLRQGSLAKPWNPSTSWSKGGPLMTRLEMLTRGHGIWYAIPICAEVIELSGKTPLIAAMRAIVASEIGDEVDVPEDLL